MRSIWCGVTVLVEAADVGAMRELLAGEAAAHVMEGTWGYTPLTRPGGGEP